MQLADDSLVDQADAMLEGSVAWWRRESQRQSRLSPHDHADISAVSRHPPATDSPHQDSARKSAHEAEAAREAHGADEESREESHEEIARKLTYFERLFFRIDGPLRAVHIELKAAATHTHPPLCRHFYWPPDTFDRPAVASHIYSSSPSFALSLHS